MTDTTSKKSAHSLNNHKPSIDLVEAQSWKLNDRGQIELFSVTNNHYLPETSATCS
jgi:hypothetical protein